MEVSYRERECSRNGGSARARAQTRPFSYKNGTYPAAKRPADEKYVTKGAKGGERRCANRANILFAQTRALRAFFPRKTLINIFEPRANQVSDQARQTRDPLAPILDFAINAATAYVCVCVCSTRISIVKTAPRIASQSASSRDQHI